MVTKGQFLVLDYHPFDLEKWISVSKVPAGRRHKIMMCILCQFRKNPRERVHSLQKNSMKGIQNAVILFKLFIRHGIISLRHVF